MSYARRLVLLLVPVLVTLGLMGSLAAASASAADPPTCDDAEITAHAGEATPVQLECFNSDFDSVQPAIVTAPAHGTLVHSSDPAAGPDDFIYTPTAGFNGDDMATFHATDAGGTSNTATVTLHSHAVDEAPTCNDIGDAGDPTPVFKNHSASVAPDCSDAENDTLTYSKGTGPAHGAVSGPDADGQFSYTPSTGYTGADSFTIIANDGHGKSSAPETVFLDVQPAPAPSCTDPGDTALDVRTNTTKPIFEDCFDEAGDPLTVTVVAQPAHGSVVQDPEDDTPGAFQYTPATGFSGDDSFTFKATSVNGTSATYTQLLHVDPSVNEAPECFDQDLDAPTGRDTTGNVDCFDADNDPLTYTVTTPVAHGTLTGPDNNGDFTYHPTTGFTGDDSFTFTANDGHGGTSEPDTTVTFHVAPPQPPTCTSPSAVTMRTNTTRELPADCSDPQNDDVTLVPNTQPTHGTLTVDGDFGFTYTPNNGYSGPDSFTYHATSVNGNSNVVTQSITVSTTANTPPDCSPESLDLREGSSATADIGCFDADNDTITYSVKTPPAHGSVGAIQNGDAGVTIKYTAPSVASGYTGPDSFVITANDAHTGGSVDEVVPVTVEPSTFNRAPSCDPSASLNALPGTATTFDPNDVCSDEDGDTLTPTVLTAPTHGTVTVGADKLLHYTSATGYQGGDSFTFRVDDGHGGQSGASDVTVTVAPPADHAPVCDSISNVQVNHNTAKAVSLSCSDQDAGSTLTYSIVANPAHGTLSGTGVNRTYTPNPGYTGPDSFTYKANDGTLDSNVATVTLNVLAGSAPTCPAQNVSTAVGTAKPITLSCTDPDAGDTGALTYSIVANPSHGTLSGTGASRTYTPVAGYAGPDSFTYKATDSSNLSSPTATVSITVTPPNQAPTCASITVPVPHDTATPIDLSCTDADSNPLTYTIVSQPKHGTLSGSGASRTYTPANGYTGADSFTYRANDGKADSNVATATLNVAGGPPPTNHAPVCAAKSVSVAHDTATPVALSCTDADGDTLTYAVVTNPAHGTLSGTGANRTYTPASGYSGPDSFTYRASDGTADSNTATVSLTVAAAPNTGPTTGQVTKSFTTDVKTLVKLLNKTKIKKLLKSGAKVKFHFLEGGKVTITITTLVKPPKKGKASSLDKKAKAKKVVVAKATGQRSSKGTSTLKIKLTAQGKKLLKKSKKLKVTVSASFKPKAGKTIKTSKTATLKK